MLVGLAVAGAGVLRRCRPGSTSATCSRSSRSARSSLAVSPRWRVAYLAPHVATFAEHVRRPDDAVSTRQPGDDRRDWLAIGDAHPVAARASRSSRSCHTAAAVWALRPAAPAAPRAARSGGRRRGAVAGAAAWRRRRAVAAGARDGRLRPAAPCRARGVAPGARRCRARSAVAMPHLVGRPPPSTWPAPVAGSATGSATPRSRGPQPRPAPARAAAASTGSTCGCSSSWSSPRSACGRSASPSRTRCTSTRSTTPGRRRSSSRTGGTAVARHLRVDPPAPRQVRDGRRARPVGRGPRQRDERPRRAGRGRGHRARRDEPSTGRAGERVHVATGDEIHTLRPATRAADRATSTAPGASALAIDTTGPPADHRRRTTARSPPSSSTCIGADGADGGPTEPTPLSRRDAVTHCLVADDGATIIAASTDGLVSSIDATTGAGPRARPSWTSSTRRPPAADRSLHADPAAIPDRGRWPRRSPS